MREEGKGRLWMRFSRKLFHFAPFCIFRSWQAGRSVPYVCPFVYEIAYFGVEIGWKWYR